MKDAEIVAGVIAVHVVASRQRGYAFRQIVANVSETDRYQPNPSAATEALASKCPVTQPGRRKRPSLAIANRSRGHFTGRE